MKAAALVVLAAALSGSAYVVGERIWRGFEAKAAFHHMRYCVAPGGSFPMHPCADDEDAREVVQS